MAERCIGQIGRALHNSQLILILEHAQILNRLGHRNQHCRLERLGISRICAESDVILFKAHTDTSALG
ncbi:hypothetical protein D3C80_1876370 [compost metagenome]